MIVGIYLTEIKGLLRNNEKSKEIIEGNLSQYQEDLENNIGFIAMAPMVKW